MGTSRAADRKRLRGKNTAMDMGSGMSMTMDMEMYFHFSRTVRHLLFETWNVRTDGELFGAMVFSFVLAILYEGLKTVRDVLAQWTHKWLNPSRSSLVNSSETTSLVKTEIQTIVRYRLCKLWLMRAVQSVLRTVEIGMAYILMLLAMTFNGWIFLSVCVGAGVGYFVFVHFRSSGHSSDEHCG